MSGLVPAPISGPGLQFLIFSANAPVLYELQLLYARSSIFTNSLILPVILGPNITGGFGQLNEISCGGVFYKGGTYAENIKTGQSWTNSTVMFDATRVSSIYGASTTVQPYSLVFNYIIKY